MEVLDKNLALLSNFEVLKVINETLSDFSSSSKYINPNLFDSLSIVQQYLEITPCNHHSEIKIEEFLKAIQKYPTILREEKLQILNIHPTKPVDLFILINCCEDRYNDDEVQDILSIVQKTLGNQYVATTTTTTTHTTDKDNNSIINNS